MGSVLQDLIVVDLTDALWSSLGAAFLGDFGARVIRLDPASARGNGSSGWNHEFELANRNKQSLAVDLDSRGGREVVHGLIGKADVFVTDRPLDFLKEKACDYAALSALKPDLIYARGSGFGPKGPDRDLPALDELAAARTGVMPTLPQPDQPPVYAGSGQMYTTVMLAFGILTALHHRAHTGEGQEVDVSLLGGNMYGASLDLQAYLAIGGEKFLRPVSRYDVGNPMSGTLYMTSDDRWVTLTMPDTDRWWPGFSEIVGLNRDDPRFDSHEKRCEQNRLELIGELEKAFRRHAAKHWRAQFNERQLSADVIEEYAYPTADEQVYRNRYILDVDDPSLGPLKMLGFPILLKDSPARFRSRAPTRGQHSAQVLHELLGYSEDRIVELQAQGVVGG